MDEGFFVSFSGIVTFKGSHELREVARQIPLDRLMVETDAPFLAPEGHRGRRNEPLWVSVVGETLAALHECTAEQLAARTTKNPRSGRCGAEPYRTVGGGPARPGQGVCDASGSSR